MRFETALLKETRNKKQDKDERQFAGSLKDKRFLLS